MWIYAVLPALFLFLFLRSRGLFRHAAHYLSSRIPQFSGMPEQVLARAMLLLLCFDLLAFCAALKDRADDPLKSGRIPRVSEGGEAYTIDATVTWQGEDHAYSLHVLPKEYPAAYVEACLSDAEAQLDALFSPYAVTQTEDPAGSSFRPVTGDLSFPVSFPDNPAVLTWFTDRTDLLSSEGILSPDVPSEGAYVTVYADLTLQDIRRSRTWLLFILPPVLTEEEAFLRSLKKSVEEKDDPTSPYMTLPDALDGAPLAWSSAASSRGPILLFLGIVAAFACIYAYFAREKARREAYAGQLARDYPPIVDQLVLLLGAGLSLRSAFYRIADDYRKKKEKGGRSRAGYEEILSVVREMDRGIPEIEAYRNLGSRTGMGRYRTLSLLITQQLVLGSDRLLTALRKEAEEAFEERRLRARILGEKASTRLLLPMMLMLCIILVITTVPAFLTLM